MIAPVIVDPPVRGEWSIFNPPGHPRLAFDFLAVNARRSPYKDVSLLRHMFSSINVDNTLAWGAPVYAVLPGIVLVASDGVPDRLHLSMIRDLVTLMFFGPKIEPPFSKLGGNHVILDCGGVFPLYAHLRCGSVRVRPGQRVLPGEVLGFVGNSGASLQPHLHFQVMHSCEPFPLFKNLAPFVLSNARRRQGDEWHDVVGHAPKSGEHYLFAEGAA